MVRVCYLCGYNSKRRHPNAGNESPRSMHRIPKRKEIRVQWLNVCGLTEEIADKYSAIHICSSHFTPEDYIESNTKPKTLKPGTKPSLNLSPENWRKDFGLVKSRISREGLESIKTFALIMQEYKNKNFYLQEMFNCSNELDKYKCVKCDYQTSFKVNLMTHVCSSNQQDETDFVKTYICENCNFETSSCLLLGKHVYSDCKTVIRSIYDQKLSENFGNSDESEENDYFEKEIGKGDKNEVIEDEYNKSNNGTHITKEIKWFKCKNCKFKSERKHNLKKHILSKHTAPEKIKWFECENCSFQTKLKSNLNQHIHLKHTAPEKIKWFKCENCSFQSKKKDHLDRHIFSKHTASEKVKWFKCKNCSFQTMCKSSLKRHILAKHTVSEQIEWFKCKNCSYQCKRKSSLNIHILSQHTALEEIKWLKCNNCSYQTKHKCNLNQHIKLKHTAREKIKWFKCENCSFQSKKKDHLNRHILSKHTASEKVKWFKCNDCPFQTKLKCSLKRHILAKHASSQKIQIQVQVGQSRSLGQFRDGANPHGIDTLLSPRTSAGVLDPSDQREKNTFQTHTLAIQGLQKFQCLRKRVLHFPRRIRRRDVRRLDLRVDFVPSKLRPCDPRDLRNIISLAAFCLCGHLRDVSSVTLRDARSQFLDAFHALKQYVRRKQNSRGTS